MYKSHRKVTLFYGNGIFCCEFPFFNIKIPLKGSWGKKTLVGVEPQILGSLINM
jgi:hypothetical protein